MQQIVKLNGLALYITGVGGAGSTTPGAAAMAVAAAALLPPDTATAGGGDPDETDMGRLQGGHRESGISNVLF